MNRRRKSRIFRRTVRENGIYDARRWRYVIENGKLYRAPLALVGTVEIFTAWEEIK